MTGPNLLAGPPPTYLPDSPEAREALAHAADPADVARAWPTYCAAWAALAERALARAGYVEAYAYARTGYHRGLDQLRQAGWKGHGGVPWSHEPNRGWLRCVAALARAADAIGEEAEGRRCRALLDDSDPQARAELDA